MKSIRQFFSTYQLHLIAIALTVLSIATFLPYFANGLHLLYADSISRLDISRKVIDNLTPGLAQLGNVWLPLPQILMLPFIWHNYLWHSGIAGYIMSGSMFVLGGLFVYKSAKLLTKSTVASLFSLSVYALNINLLYLQTTAMSESIFLATLAATMYYFISWFKFYRKRDLLYLAFAVCCMTLIRYEGLAILLSSIPLVFIYSWIRGNYTKAEGNTIIYSMLACLGFGMWTLYLTIIFGDPLYWKNFYASSDIRQTYTGEVSGYTQNLSFLSATWKYFTSATWMLGLTTVVAALLGTVVMLIQSALKRSLIFLPLLLPLSLFLFMVLTLQRNTPIVQPTLNLANILASDTSQKIGFNIRYGILLLPWAAIMASYLLAMKNKWLKSLVLVICVSLLSVQVASYFYKQYSVIYQIPERVEPKKNSGMVQFMKENYDGGPVLISAAGHEDQMFLTGLDYKVFIHEGTGKYWKESLDDPPRYARWVIIDKGQNADVIARKPGIEEVLKRDYHLVFREKQTQVYKIKREPYFEIM